MTQRAATPRGAWSFCRASLVIAAAFTNVARGGRNVRITYNSEEDGSAVTRNFDLLVVACDPTYIADVFDGRTELEERVESALHSHRYTLATSLWDVRRKKADNSYTVRFWPEKLGAVDGQVYGFRDEARARTGRTRCHTLIMVYQFANAPLSKEIIVEKLNDAMLPTDDVGDALEPPEYEILGLQPESSEMLDMVHEDGYFPHFSQVQDAFQAAREASTKPRVAVIGAGPSGLLFTSQQLKEAGFEDITLFEKQDRYGGKTLTSFHKAPGYPHKKIIPAEQGTCYMSAAYQAFWTMMETKYGMEKPVRLSFGKNEPEVRGIVVEGTDDLVGYKAWTLTGLDGEQLSLDDFGIALGTYAVAHYSLVGWNSLDSTAPIPASIPADLPNMTFLEYLQALGLDVLQNIFTFAITVQGYGALEEIPAYYGLIWMPPDALAGPLDFAASASEQLASEKAAAVEDDDGSEESDTEHRRLLAETTSIMRHGARVVRDVRRSAERVLRESGEHPSFEWAEELAIRSHERVLAGEDDDEGDDPRLDGVGLVQEGWQKVWDRIVYQEGLRSKIKLGVDITKIERRGLGDYA